ncbi:MAG: transporter substrate-binding domain-containing protein, partial [Chloroflexi bacterium]|nr:transporter substrate-binding domain-containing protein [Chloroflexota bacterium]
MFQKNTLLSVMMATLLASLILLSLAACTSQDAEPTDIPMPATVVVETSEQIEFPESIVAKLQRGEALIAGVKVDSPPWGFLDADGNRVGFDVALVRALAERWGVAVEFVTVTSADRLEKLAAGEVDLVAASMTHRRDREEFADFSITYFLDGQALLVAENSGIQTLADLDGMAVAAARGTTSIENLRTEADKLGIQVAVVEVDDH